MSESVTSGAQFHRSDKKKAKQNHANQNKVTSQNSMSLEHVVTGILINDKQRFV